MTVELGSWTHAAKCPAIQLCKSPIIMERLIGIASRTFFFPNTGHLDEFSRFELDRWCDQMWRKDWLRAIWLRYKIGCKYVYKSRTRIVLYTHCLALHLFHRVCVYSCSNLFSSANTTTRTWIDVWSFLREQRASVNDVCYDLYSQFRTKYKLCLSYN